MTDDPKFRYGDQFEKETGNMAQWACFEDEYVDSGTFVDWIAERLEKAESQNKKLMEWIKFSHRWDCETNDERKLSDKCTCKGELIPEPQPKGE